MIVLSGRQKRAATLSDIWMATHFDYKELNKALKDLGVEKPKKVELSKKEVKAEWNKLAGALRGFNNG